jgi:hypothetical protein
VQRQEIQEIVPMLRQLITTFAARTSVSGAKAARLQPAELQEILDSIPEVARKLRARHSMLQDQPRSVCTSLKDLCEL